MMYALQQCAWVAVDASRPTCAGAAAGVVSNAVPKIYRGKAARRMLPGLSRKGNASSASGKGFGRDADQPGVVPITVQLTRSLWCAVGSCDNPRRLVHGSAEMCLPSHVELSWPADCLPAMDVPV